MYSEEKQIFSYFKMSRDYLTSPVGRGHAPNQDLADIIGAVLVNECVRHLNNQMPGQMHKSANSSIKLLGLIQCSMGILDITQRHFNGI